MSSVETISIDGTPLTPTLCAYAHIDPVIAASKRGTNYRELFKHGTVSSGEKWADELVFQLVLIINRGGNGRDNLQTVKSLINRYDRLVTIERSGTSWGTYSGKCEVLGGIPAAAAPGNLLTVPMVLPAGFWSGELVQNQSGTFVVGGDAPTDDIVMDITGGTDVVVTHTNSGRTVSLVGATPSGGVRIDVKAGTVTRISDGTNYDEFFRYSDPRWIEMLPGSNTFSVTGGGTISIDYRPQRQG